MSTPTLQADSEFVDLPPKPSCLVESLRDIGYEMPTAIADLIDNSIAAQARNISIRFTWNDGDPWMSIYDDGHGMSREELIQAMRLGSQSPLEERSKSDLGRFGLGMKTASFSQCRQLTVISKKSGQEPFACEWDLDALEQSTNDSWRLRIPSLKESEDNSLMPMLVRDGLKKRKSGTIVLWRCLDRIAHLEVNEIRESVFDAKVEDIRNHLQRVFHRLLVTSGKRKKVSISINDSPLVPFDPFFLNHDATQEMPEQVIKLNENRITVRPYVLPHHSKMTNDEWNTYAGQGGYLQNQGFYVYRNLRLIISGTWFRILKKQELTKLVRIRVDIPNTLDGMWEIDVKKSHASPPESIRRELKKIIERIEIRGKKVYRQRGTVVAQRAKQPAWSRVAKGGGIQYEINRKHPLLLELLSSCNTRTRELLNDLVSTLESTFPSDLYYADMASNPEDLSTPAVSEDELKAMLLRFIEVFKPDGNLDSERIEKLLEIEPFASHRDTIQRILKEGK